MNVRRFLFALVFAFVPALFFAQVAADPLDYFYDDLEIWETMGLVNNLPAARPYPLQLVRSILETVIETGDQTQMSIACTHYRRIFGRVFSGGFKTELAVDSKNRKEMGVALSFDLNYTLNDLVTASASIDGWATNKLFGEELLPEGEESSKDIVADNAKVGPFWILPSVDSSVGVGTPEYYVNAGLMRGSFGPFHSNGVIVGPQSLHTSQFDFAVNKPLWGFNLSLYSLSASSADDPYNPEAWDPQKYLSVHTIEWRPTSRFSVSILESMMFGDRFDPSYILPLTPYMINQGLTGFQDNSWLGGMFTVKPVDGLKVDGVFYADDLSFNDIIRFNFDTKWRFAGQLGTSWAPRASGIFTRISVDYTMLTPYTYSHRNEDEEATIEATNSQNYTHAGRAFGADLQPNSDRINLKLKLRPLEDVDVDLVGTLIRHGNVNEGIGQKYINEYLKDSTHKYVTDGSIFNSSYTAAGHAFNYSTPFLTQDTLQYIWQTGFDVLCRLPILKSGGQIIFKMGYRFECNINDGINESIYYYDSSADSASEDTLKDLAAAQYKVWLDDATGMKLTHYISAGFEVSF